MNPIDVFRQWFAEEKALSKLKLPAACCLSTVGVDGYPNSRFVSFKEISNESLVITGPLDSRKGIEIENSPKAAITFWWTSTERQIRIQGDVSKIPESKAEILFGQRNRDSKIVSTVFEQGKEIESIQQLQNKFTEYKESLSNEEIKRPQSWGGIYVRPIRIEFMAFRQSRLHERKLYTRVADTWEMKIIQP